MPGERQQLLPLGGQPPIHLQAFSKTAEPLGTFPDVTRFFPGVPFPLASLTSFGLQRGKHLGFIQMASVEWLPLSIRSLSVLPQLLHK